MDSEPRQSILDLSIQLLIPLVIPVLTLLTSVRVLLSPVFIQLEYALPGFPPDPYGFSKAERLKWANLSLEYLLNDEGIEFLGDLELGAGTPLYNDRELNHMEDVKEIVEIVLVIWSALIVALLGLVFIGGFTAGWVKIGRSLGNGAKLTFILMVALLLGVIVIFPIVFVAFHEIFFDPGTWMFSFQDSLIRLFPQRFWQTAFLAVGILTLIQVGIIYLIGRLLSRVQSRNVM
jgi:integral membrane protein (TIGR01906 family)